MNYIVPSVPCPIPSNHLALILDLCIGKKVSYTYALSFIGKKLGIDISNCSYYLNHQTLVDLNKLFPFIEVNFWHQLT
jgi:hypothetical protein